MSAGKHTPGPWFDNGIAIKRGRITISHLPAAGGEETLANARLIAAAPDLLAVLRDIQIAAVDADLLASSWRSTLETIAAKARAAIAKATGSDA